MTSTYRRAFAIPGAAAFSAAGVLARLPISMVSLGIVVLVSTRTGSYAAAGAVSAAWVVANAVGSLPLARFVDRRGQGRVLGPAVSVSVLALAGLVVAVERGLPVPWPHLCAAVSGLCLPNVGAAVRARWAHVLRDRSVLDTAYAVEAVNDELVFIVGPTLVTSLAALVHPVAGLTAAGLAALTGTWLLVRQRATEPPRHTTGEGAGAVAAMPWLRLLPLVVGAVMQGVLFGGVEVATVALADELGQESAAGVLLAVWALGSLLSGLVAGSVTVRRPPAERYRLGALALVLLLLPTPFVGSLVAMAGVLFLCGFAISPTMIAAVSWVESVVPRARLNEGMAAFSTGLVAGVAPGAALVGVVVDAHGASTGYWVPCIAGAVGVLVAFATARRPALSETTAEVGSVAVARDRRQPCEQGADDRSDNGPDRPGGSDLDDGQRASPS